MATVIEYAVYFALALVGIHLIARAAATGWFRVKLRYQKRLMGIVEGEANGQPKAD